MTAKKAERRGDMVRAERRDVGADEHRRPRRTGNEGMAHPLAEIAAALPDNRNSARPEPLALQGGVRGDREAQMPSPVSTEAKQYPRQHQPLETQRRNVAD